MTEDDARAEVVARFSEALTERLARFAALVVAENAAQNLIAPSTIDHIWARHVLDSLQLLALAPEGHWLDIGTGGGFPGLAIAIASERSVTLVEPRKRRARFLADCVDQLGLADRVTVVAARIASVDVEADVISARGERCSAGRTIVQRPPRAGCYRGVSWIIPACTQPKGNGDLCSTWNTASPILNRAFLSWKA